MSLAIGTQTLLPPTPVAAIATTAKASSSTTFVIGQFYLIGKMSISGAQTIPPFEQTIGRISGGTGPFTNWLIQDGFLGTIPAFGQVATVTSTRAAAAAQTMASFGVGATAAHPSMGAVQTSTLAAFGQTATAAALLKLAAGQILVPFATAAAGSSTRKAAGAQALNPFTQVAVIPGYAAFVANARTYQAIAEQRGYTPTPEQRSLSVDPEARTNFIS